MAKRGRKAHRLVLTFNTIVGEADNLVNGDYPECPLCHKIIRESVLSLVQHGFFENKETDVFWCPNDNKHISYTYNVTFED